MVLTTFLFADYYSCVDTHLEGQKEIDFDKGLVLHVDGEKPVKIVAKVELNWIDDGKSARKYEPFSVKKKDEERLYPVYNFQYLLKKKVDDKMFVLKTKSGYLLVKTKKRAAKLQTPLFGDVTVTKLSYKVERSVGKKIDIPKEDIAVKFLDDEGNLVALELMDGDVQKVKKCITPDLKRFLKEKASRKTKVEKFDFSKEKLYMSYVSQKESETKRMKLEYSMKKKYIKAVLKAPISLFDPEYKDDTLSSEVGILREANGELYEVKKVQIINGSKEIVWVNHPKKSVVIVNYNNNGVKDQKIFSKSKGQQFYAIEGVLYLVSWMDKNKVEKKVFTFVNGTIPFDVTMKKDGAHSYSMEKNGKVIYAFEVDDRDFLKKIEYPSYDITIKLESVDNDTTLANKEFLRNFMRKHHIKLIKE